MSLALLVPVLFEVLFGAGFCTVLEGAGVAPCFDEGLLGLLVNPPEGGFFPGSRLICFDGAGFAAGLFVALDLAGAGS